MLITQQLVLAVDCTARPSGAANLSRANALTSTPADSLGIANIDDSLGEEMQLVLLAGAASYERIVAWSNRAVYPGEALTAWRYDQGGTLQQWQLVGAEVLAAYDSERAAPHGETAPVFGSDGQLLAFCSIDPRGAIRRCVPLAAYLARSKGLRRYHAMTGVLLGDATGDGAADAVVINADGTILRSAQAGGLGAWEAWGSPLGSNLEPQQTLFADVSGDGLSDLITVNSDSVVVQTSTRSGFAVPVYWSTTEFAPSQLVLVGNVDGVAGDDLVYLKDGRFLVQRSNGLAFGSPESWGAQTDASSELLSVHLADVTGDGLADIVLVGSDGIAVRVSSGDAFLPAVRWLAASPGSSPGWFFADVTGDGAADAIVLAAGCSQVFPAKAGRFAIDFASFSVMPPLGTRANYFADMTGDGIADAIIQNDRNVEVCVSTGTQFAVPQVWSAIDYTGGL